MKESHIEYKRWRQLIGEERKQKKNVKKNNAVVFLCKIILRFD
jgi:hypothetical protein